MALRPFHLNPEQGRYRWGNVEVRNVAKLNTLRDVRSRRDEDCLHLGIGIGVAMSTRGGCVGDEVSFRLIGEHIAGLGSKYQVGSLVALFGSGQSKFSEFLLPID